jgi:hypothetical protein
MKLPPVKTSEQELISYAQELVSECPFQYQRQFQRYATYEILSFVTGVSMLQEESDTHGYCEPFCDSDVVTWKVETLQKLHRMLEAIMVRHQKHARQAMLN